MYEKPTRGAKSALLPLHAARGDAVGADLKYLRRRSRGIEQVHSVIHFFPGPAEEVVIAKPKSKRQAIIQLVIVLRIERQIELAKAARALLVLVDARRGSAKQQIGQAQVR